MRPLVTGRSGSGLRGLRQGASVCGRLRLLCRRHHLGGLQLADAERIQHRTQELAKTHLVSDADSTKADTQVLDLRAQLTRAEAELTAARSDAKRALEMLGKHRIVAPFAGVVTDKNAQPGEIISPMSAGGGFTRTGLCTIVDMASLEVEVDVNEAYIQRVQTGQKVSATLDAYPDWQIPAHVITTIPAADRQKATVKVRIGFDALDLQSDADARALAAEWARVLKVGGALYLLARREPTQAPPFLKIDVSEDGSLKLNSLLEPAPTIRIRQNADFSRMVAPLMVDEIALRRDGLREILCRKRG